MRSNDDGYYERRSLPDDGLLRQSRIQRGMRGVRHPGGIRENAASLLNFVTGYMFGKLLQSKAIFLYLK